MLFTVLVISPRAVLLKFTLSVRMYEIYPFSYNFCAISMVLETPYPNFRDASCCNVEVVNGGAGERLPGFTCTSLTVYPAPLHDSRKVAASSAELCFFPSAVKFTDLPETSFALNNAWILKVLIGTNALISRSLSAIKRTATL